MNEHDVLAERFEAALAFSSRARAGRAALVNGAVGVVVAPRGRLFGVGILTIRHGTVTEMDLVGDPVRLRQLDLAVLND